MKQVIRLTESDLHRVIKESVKKILREAPKYDSTMQHSGDVFDQNTIKGKIRSKLDPKKYQQYQRIKKKGEEMGRQAVDNINDERDKVRVNSVGGYGPFDYVYLDFSDYAYSQGIEGLGELPPEPPRENNYDAYMEYLDKIRPIKKDARSKGESLYNQRVDKDQKRLDKYGENGRILKPWHMHDTSEYYSMVDAYKKQRQELKNKKNN